MSDATSHRAANDLSIVTTYARQALEWGDQKAIARTARIFGVEPADVLDALDRWSSR